MAVVINSFILHTTPKCGFGINSKLLDSYFSRANIESFRYELLLRILSTNTAAKEVRHFDKERPPIAVQSRFELSGKWIKAATINVIVVPNIKRSAWIRRPAEQELALGVRRQRIKINASAHK